MSKITAKEYLKEMKNSKKGDIVNIQHSLLEKLLEDFAALKVKESTEDSETFEGWAVYGQKDELWVYTIRENKQDAKNSLTTNWPYYESIGCSIKPITVTVKKKNHEK